MPHPYTFETQATRELQQESNWDAIQQKRSRRASLLKSIGGLWKKPQGLHESSSAPSTIPTEPSYFDHRSQPRRPSLPDSAIPATDRQGAAKAVPSLPRPQTFRRQESEQRDRLLEIPRSSTERRAVSLDRRRDLSASAARRSTSPKHAPLSSLSALETPVTDQQPGHQHNDGQAEADGNRSSRNRPELPPLQIPESVHAEVQFVNDDDEQGIDHNSLKEEYNQRWILNLSMQFRDNSRREKFFVTYAEKPTKWRRLTISLDYRNAPPDSLEADVCTLKFQRDKSFRIYEAIRESLGDIQFYTTVTNLKLETAPQDGQLHVHVREDANEIVQYPELSLFAHIDSTLVPEGNLEFDSHISGFVYKVQVGGAMCIKKEIPGPDTVDEFLYEVNALSALVGCENVIQLEGLVTDDSGSVVKGLLISYAAKGSLVDVIYDLRGTSEEPSGLPWHRREMWAQQIVQGLSDIHEAGFVQGDFTLSNIVIDGEDNARIIDINRRGCPVGWEPPELNRLVRSGQRVGMSIGVKTDLFQLGMVLWALARETDEPEQFDRPLPPVSGATPSYFASMVDICLSERPQGRMSAKRLLRLFPPTAGLPPSPNRLLASNGNDMRASGHSISTHRSDREYINPDMAVTIEDVNASHRRHGERFSPISAGQVQYLEPRDPDSNPASSNYYFDSSGSWILAHRGRSPVSSRRGRSSPFARSRSSSATSLSRSPPSRGDRRRGSDCSYDNRAAEAPPMVLDGPEIDRSDEKGSRETMNRDEVSAPRSARTTNIQSAAVDSPSSLLHTDSGFDEHVDQDLDFEHAVSPARPES